MIEGVFDDFGHPFINALVYLPRLKWEKLPMSAEEIGQ